MGERIAPRRSASHKLSMVAKGFFILAIVLSSPFAARAGGPYIGQFELKNLEAGEDYFEFQSQNAYTWGQPGRRVAPGEESELEFDDNTITRQRHALEAEVGFTDFFKMRVGIEYEKERLDEPGSLGEANSFDDLKLSEVGVEAIVVLVPRKGDGAGLGAVVEFEKPISSDEANAILLGAIIEWASGPWSVSLVPAAVHSFGGEADEETGERDDKWDFSYAAQLLYKVSDAWSLGVESYGTVDRIGDTGFRDDAALKFGDFNQHRLGPIVYYTYELDKRGPKSGAEKTGAGEEGTTATVGLGAFAGLNENTPDQTLKLSLEVDF